VKSILITGGARSGKSKLALELAAEAGGKVLFVATAEAGDDEMKQRIKAHRKARPKEWTTLEATTHIGSRIVKNIGGAKMVVIDCITLLINNIFEEHGGKAGPAALEKAVTSDINELLECIKKIKADFIIVTNEVGLGIIPGDRVSRLYRDLLGKANQMLAKKLDEVYMMVAGIPVAVKKN
jgi:adenosylcobinamide kinase/adenosylcobinamide-phosphate guanylyltransferase